MRHRTDAAALPQVEPPSWMSMRFLSLFSGIEADSAAFNPLGWQAVGFSEIEPFPCAVLAHHHPCVPNLGDVSRITREQIEALGPIDLVCGGFPCQDLSVAGNREGLRNTNGEATRSGLFFDAMRVVGWARPRWVLIENVPGMLSSNRGHDFAAVVGEMAGCGFGVPADGWPNSGAAVGPHGLVEWATLDAQFFGLAQRRKRVFLVRDSGDWADREPVLLERESLLGHPAPRRDARQDVAPTVAGGARKRGGYSSDDIPAVAGTLNAGMGRRSAEDPERGLLAFGGNKTTGPRDVASALSAHGGSGRMNFESETFVTHALRGEGFDASEDGTGRGTPLVPLLTFHHDAQPDEQRFDPHVTAALTCSQHAAVAFSCKDHGADAGDVSPTLRSMGHDGSHANGGGQVAVSYSTKLHNTTSNQAGKIYEEYTTALDRSSPPPALLSRMQIRLLTPTECARLQGLPDNHLDILIRGKPAADGPKYKALGNSWAVPVVCWIGQRIQMAHAATEKEAA